ncbi:MAG TPA: DsrE/DsrF/DrsH-like family protein [Methanomassiliicoccales archaeon]|nr:DsrE/DsrF/DrsH-like family protein [Methanomassiliicoccales archaeon]
MAKVAIVVNGGEPKNVYPPFVLGTSALAVGNDVIMFFCPAGGMWCKKGELEKITGKGMPPMTDLIEKFNKLGGKLYLCELALEARDIKREDVRNDTEIIGATEFMTKASDCTVTFSF